jgi:hypothetical protein
MTQEKEPRFAQEMTQEKEPESKNGVLAILRLVLGAGVTPAQGGAEPTVVSAFNGVIYPSPDARA